MSTSRNEYRDAKEGVSEISFDSIDFDNYFKEPMKAELIEGTPFYRNAVNLVYAPSKTGKSMTIAQVLSEAGLSGKEVVWLDADHQSNVEMQELLNGFIWVNSNLPNLERMLLGTQGDGRVLVFDSLKDFARGKSLDNNDESQMLMQYLREFYAVGFTVIVIAHTTRYTNKYDGSITDKIKGNEETIKSKCDAVFKLEKGSKSRTFNLELTRFDTTEDSKKFSVISLDSMKQDATELFKKLSADNEWIPATTLRDSLSSDYRSHIHRLENVIFEVQGAGVKGNPKQYRFLVQDDLDKKAVGQD